MLLLQRGVADLRRGAGVKPSGRAREYREDDAEAAGVFVVQHDFCDRRVTDEGSVDQRDAEAAASQNR